MNRENPPGEGGFEPEHGGGGDVRRRVEAGFLTAYKPELGRSTRTGTFVGAGLLIVWGAYTLHTHLVMFAEGGEWWRPLVSPGIPLAVAVVFLSVVGRIAFVIPRTSDFMIATEGEMKKVNWSTKREVIGSTKVVIVFVFLFAAVLFVIDLAFQELFKWMGVLKI